MVVGIVVVFLLILLGGGGFFINSSLSTTYSPQRAVTDYFAAQSRADVNTMLTNATYVKGDSTFSAFFTPAALTAMMKDADNKSVSGVKVTSTSELDSSTSKVTVSMTWAGTSETKTYTVRKDTARQHDLFYYSWRVDIPVITINVTLPNQPGTVQVDGLDVPAASQKSLQVIQGYHSVTMKSTDFYDETSLSANGVDSDTASVTFPSKLGSTAMTAVVASITAAFGNVTCDVNTYFDCPNHAYKPKPGYYEILPLPKGDVNAYTSWSWAFTGDPTTGMTLVVTSDAGKITASGTCASVLTVDGSKKYNFTGVWTGTLTDKNNSFASDVLENCDKTES